MSIFDALSDADAAAVRQAGTRVTSPEGWALMAQSTPSDKAYILVRGEASVRRGGTEVARIGAGEVFGEAGIVHRKLRNATIVALTDLELLHFTAAELRDVTARVPAFGEALAQGEASRAER